MRGVIVSREATSITIDVFPSRTATAYIRFVGPFNPVRRLANQRYIIELNQKQYCKQTISLKGKSLQPEQNNS